MPIKLPSPAHGGGAGGGGSRTIDAFTYWSNLQRLARDSGAQAAPDTERARWRTLARTYDRSALHTSAPEFVARVAGLVRPGETVLEIGPGTGGFTLPVAVRAARVTALDMSEAMLAALEQRLVEGDVRNVETVSGEWPQVDVAPHDLVLAVNSLYRVEDARACIERMSASARRRVVVAWSVGHNPPVLPSIVDPDGPRAYRPGVTYIHLLLALHELGIEPDLSIHRVPRLVWRAGFVDATEQLLGGVPDPTPAERAEAAALAQRVFTPDGDGVVRRYEGQVAVICWDGSEA